MQARLRPYLAAFRREVAAVTAGQQTFAAYQLAHCVSPLVAHLVAREECAEVPLDEFEKYIKKVLAAAMDGVDQEQVREIGKLLPRTGASPTARQTKLLEAVEATLTLLGPESDKREMVLRHASVAQARLQKALDVAAAEIIEELGVPEPPAQDSLSVEEAQRVVDELLPQWAGARVNAVQQHPGLHAKEVHFLRVEQADGKTAGLVLRRDRADDSTQTSTADEFPVMRAMFERGFQIPEPLAVSTDPAVAGRPVVLMRRADGFKRTVDTLPNHDVVMPQVADFLAKLHRTPVEGCGLPGPVGGDITGMWRDRFRGDYEAWLALGLDPAPIIHRAWHWLDANAPVLSDVAAVVHGDLCLRNMLFDDSGVTSILDWEFSHVGHPAEDLGFLAHKVKSNPVWEGFTERYLAAGGHEVTEDQKAVGAIWRTFRNTVVLGTILKRFTDGDTSSIGMGMIALVDYPQHLTLLADSIEGAEARRRKGA